MQTGDVLGRPAEWLGNWGASEREDAYDLEVKQLFDQPYIDPLTRYLERYRNDESRAAHLQRVLDERNQRCRQIADKYANRPLNVKTLEQYRSGYSYSCPQQVEAFAGRLQQATESGEVEQVTTPVEPAAEIAWSGQLAQQLNDCYLLTTIGNFSAARAACTTPAEKGDPRAQYNMALIARSLTQYDEALNWAHLAAKHSAEARYLLGQLYEAGQGVEEDEINALTWYRDAAEQGNASAQYRVGRFLYEGRGVEQNLGAAMGWYERAAAQGQAEAQLALGDMLLQGEGVPPDPAQGRFWVLRAARQGLAEAQLRLGELAEQADNTLSNRAEAAVWYELAGQNGLQPGTIRAQKLRVEIAAETLQDARVRVRRALEGGR
ncbi:sel1 repeat family protein [Marinobacterium sp. D7]|uniref:tetratricopeptide repeat protein n=1 Tax=Marinobacterium ramblicola TaxID=2849041 RepID=UPI001C2D92D0|nr:tetratricopeptide repeat protein [Marinobacterium ramblicola]MBV1786864.1 sel1 repeat family protein [Marinobacterium ramblicola]